MRHYITPSFPSLSLVSSSSLDIFLMAPLASLRPTSGPSAGSSCRLPFSLCVRHIRLFCMALNFLFQTRHLVKILCQLWDTDPAVPLTAVACCCCLPVCLVSGWMDHQSDTSFPSGVTPLRLLLRVTSLGRVHTYPPGH